MKNLLCILCLFFWSSLFAQPKHVFEIVNENSPLFNSQERETVRKMIDPTKNSKITKGWAIAFSKIEAVQEFRNSLQLPGVGPELEAISEHTSEVEQNLIGKTTFIVWGGKLHGARKKGEFLLLKGDNGSFGGVLQFNGNIFEIL